MLTGKLGTSAGAKARANAWNMKQMQGLKADLVTNVDGAEYARVKTDDAFDVFTFGKSRGDGSIVYSDSYVVDKVIPVADPSFNWGGLADMGGLAGTVWGAAQWSKGVANGFVGVGLTTSFASSAYSYQQAGKFTMSNKVNLGVNLGLTGMGMYPPLSPFATGAAIGWGAFQGSPAGTKFNNWLDR